MSDRSLLVIGPVQTLDRARPQADWLLIVDGRIAALGHGTPPDGDHERHVYARGVIAPGFDDAHLHLMAMAAARRSLDCTAVTSIDELLSAIGAASGEWVRAWGYDDAFMTEGRHPRRSELDAVAPRRPVVLHHRTGHLVVVNTAAAVALGVDPPDGVLVDAHEALSRAPRQPLAGALAEVSRELLAAGVVSVTDATHTNRPDDDELIAALSSIAPRVTIMNVDGPTKVMPRAGRLDEIAPAVARAHAEGRSAAVHVDDIDVLEATLAAFEASPGAGRIEHGALILPEQIARIAALGLPVVTQPAFVTQREGKYRAQLSAVEHEWLYRVGSLLEAGVEVRFSSDAPVVAARPLDAVHAAQTRALGRAERVDAATAMALHCTGPLHIGARADLVVLSAWPKAGNEARVEATYVGGRCLFRRDPGPD